MKLFICLLLVLINLPELIDAETKMVMIGHFHCGLAKHWCVNLKYYEMDIMYDDWLGRTPPYCVDGTDQTITAEVSDTDDGWWNNWYEPMVAIWHTCNPLNEYRKYEVVLQSVPVIDGTVEVDYRVDITNQSGGTRSTDLNILGKQDIDIWKINGTGLGY